MTEILHGKYPKAISTLVILSANALLSILHQAALKGIGVALLPQIICCEDLKAGRLQKVLPEWNFPLGICHAVFPSRRGLLPAVRVFIDFLAEHMPKEIQDSNI